MNSELQISVITVCRNSESTIRDAFESVLSQGYPSVDYVVVDGASSDGTVAVIQEYEHRFLSSGLQFRWISEPDRGIYDAMNKGIRMCTGDIIGILNSDDYYEPGAFNLVANAAAEHPDVGIFYGFLRSLFENEEILVYRYRYERYLLDLKTGIYSASQHPTCFVRRWVYEKIGMFDAQFSVAADHDFLIRAARAGVPFLALDGIISNFRTGGAADRMSDRERLRQRYAIFYKNGLLTQTEYRRRQNELRYKRYKELKKKLIRLVFRY